jgi:hypothetical protein
MNLKLVFCHENKPSPSIGRVTDNVCVDASHLAFPSLWRTFRGRKVASLLRQQAVQKK